MRNSRQSFSNSRGRRSGSSFGNRNRRSGGGGGRRQASFNPIHVVAQSKLQTREIEQVEEYQTIHQFNDFQIHDQIKANIARKGYVTPTPIQDQTIPHILENRDVVGIANTGTGKTAAFLIPLLDKVVQNDNEKVLIIAPTRELAIQVRDELRTFCDGLNIYSTIVIGGSSIGRQIESLRRGQHFVIGTPGRIKDLNQRGKLDFGQFTNIVLDEVDRMLDMGFVHEIRNIIQALPRERQSLFFSATITDRVKEIMKTFLHNPVHVSVKTQETAMNVEQDVVRMSGRSKIDVLHEMLETDEFEKVLVFGRTKHGMEKLSQELNYRGLRVNAIHGNKSQGQRQRALKQFRNNQVQALVATDVIARGLDIDDVSHVINFDLPESYEDYVHRIGRTGRANRTGIALTFID